MQVNKLVLKILNSEEKVTVNCSDFDIKEKNNIVVNLSNGVELANVICSKIVEVEDTEPLVKVRNASEKDLEKYKENLIKQDEIKEKTTKIVNERKLDMKIISCYLSLDCNKVAVNFIAENRVDFRELVKDLAGLFKARIELKQIGPRDETKQLGGLGPCGRPCCCKEFLDNFEHSTIKMAKTQNLSLNPTKISGLCGKLMCCLAYENDTYAEILKKMPKINSEVITKSGKGIALYNDILKQKVQVKVYSQDGQIFEIKDFDLSELQVTKTNGGNSEE